jgi:hypothetical protein
MSLNVQRTPAIIGRSLAVLGAALLLIAFTTPAARANHIDTAQVTQLTCDSFTITLSASQLNAGQNYEIDYSVSVTDTCATPGTANYSVKFMARASGTFITTQTQTFPLQLCPLTFSGNATLVGENTI